MDRDRLRQVSERIGRDIFKLGGDYRTVLRQVVECFTIIVGTSQMFAGETTGRAARIGIEYDDLVAHGARRSDEHAPQLSAAKHAEGTTGKNGHLFDGR